MAPALFYPYCSLQLNVIPSSTPHHLFLPWASSVLPLDANRNPRKTENLSVLFAVMSLAPSPESGTVGAQSWMSGYMTWWTVRWRYVLLQKAFSDPKARVEDGFPAGFFPSLSARSSWAHSLSLLVSVSTARLWAAPPHKGTPPHSWPWVFHL